MSDGNDASLSSMADQQFLPFGFVVGAALVHALTVRLPYWQPRVGLEDMPSQRRVTWRLSLPGQTRRVAVCSLLRLHALYIAAS